LDSWEEGYVRKSDYVKNKVIIQRRAVVVVAVVVVVGGGNKKVTKERNEERKSRVDYGGGSEMVCSRELAARKIIWYVRG
jgi:hypothetical protein